jgi:DNA-binding phage protein
MELDEVVRLAKTLAKPVARARVASQVVRVKPLRRMTIYRVLSAAQQT